MSKEAYDEHAKTYTPSAGKDWHAKASALALKVGGIVHDNLAHYHYKDSGGKPSGWAAWRAKHGK